MKKIIKEWFINKGWYKYARYSWFFSAYVFFFKRSVLKEHRREAAFYKSFLPHCPLIFDIGAYDGHKTAAFLQLSDRVVCCEPDSENFHTLQVRFRNQQQRVKLENKAVSDHQGTASYYIHYAASAFNTLNPKWKQILEQDKKNRWNEEIQFSNQTTVTLTTLDQLIEQHGQPTFIKIDVEGYEPWVLKGLSQKIPFLSFECLLPDCKTELLDCIEQLQKLDAATLFNVAHEEKLLFENFITYPKLVQWMEENPSFGAFEIIAKS